MKRTSSKVLTALVLLVYFFILSIPSSKVEALEQIKVTAISDPKIFGNVAGTSHNQHVVANQYGIFLTYFQTKTGTGTGINAWFLLRSTDGGKTFIPIYKDEGGTLEPVLETDPNGFIYVAYPEYNTNPLQSYLRIFSPVDNFSSPTNPFPMPGATNKYTMILDWPRRQLYYVPMFSNLLTIIGLDGTIRNVKILFQPGQVAYGHYLQMYLDTNGDLYFAWTTTPNSGQYLYRAIHVMRSRDGGQTWQKLDGTPLSLPVITDETGPTDRITLDDEFDVHTWLSTILVKNGKLHFAYWAQFASPKQHYVRYDLATGKKDRDMYPVWKGENISFASLDGFCTTKSTQNNFPLYCVFEGGDAVLGNNLGVLVSNDQGQTWHDYAFLDTKGQELYGISGAREITPDGYIIGTYTDIKGPSTNDPQRPGVVYFFKVKAKEIPTLVPFPGDLNGDRKVDIFDYNLLVADFGKTTTTTADIDKNGKVDIFDYNILVGNFGNVQ